MLFENLKDSAEILSNILNQPLGVDGLSNSVSFSQAAENYPSQQPEHSELSKMLQTFAANPEHLQTLIQELELIADDLTPN